MSANGQHHDAGNTNSLSVNGLTNGNSSLANNVVTNGTALGGEHGSSYNVPNVTEPRPVNRRVANSLRQSLISGKQFIMSHLESRFDAAAADRIWGGWIELSTAWAAATNTKMPKDLFC